MRLAAIGVAGGVSALLTLGAGPAIAAMGACEGAYVKSDPEDHVRLYTICLDNLQEEAFAGAYHNRGVAYLQLGEDERALSDFNSSLLWDPEYGLAYFNRAAIHAQRGQLERAIADLSQTLSMQPSRIHREAYMRRAMLEQGRGNYAAAIADYQAVAALPIPWFGGSERTDKKRYRAEALTAHARLLATASDATVRDGQQALELAQAAIGIEDSPAARAALAAAYAELGQMDLAMQEHGRASVAGEGPAEDERLLAAQLAAFQAGQPYREAATPCSGGDAAGCVQYAWNAERMRLYRSLINADMNSGKAVQ